LYFAINSTTYLAGGNSQDSLFVFRSANDDVDLGYITSRGTMRFTYFRALSDSIICPTFADEPHMENTRIRLKKPPPFLP
jgi:hypothetical protein